MTSSKAVDGKFTEGDKDKLLARVGNARSDPQSYVDDISTFPKNEPCLRKAAKMIGEALQTISLQSHPTKTEVIVSGRSKRAEMMKERLQAKPATITRNSLPTIES